MSSPPRESDITSLQRIGEIDSLICPPSDEVEPPPSKLEVFILGLLFLQPTGTKDHNSSQHEYGRKCICQQLPAGVVLPQVPERQNLSLGGDRTD